MEVCAICNRQAQIGYRRSHSNQKSKRLQKLNLQKANYKGKRILVCTKCIKTLSKIK